MALLHGAAAGSPPDLLGLGEGNQLDYMTAEESNEMAVLWETQIHVQ